MAIGKPVGSYVTQGSFDHASSNIADRGILEQLRARFLPALFAVGGLPLLIYATICSAHWLAVPFPGFFLMPNAVIPTVSSYDWPANQKELFHARVTSIDGAPVHSSADVYDRVASRPLGTSFHYTFVRGDERLEGTYPSFRFGSGHYLQVYGILLLIGAMNFLTGIAVGFMQPHAKIARVYLLLTVTGGIYATAPVFLHQSGFPLLTRLYLFGESFFPAAFIHFAMVFPVAHHMTGGRLAIVVTSYLLGTTFFVSALAGFFREPPILWPLYGNYWHHAASYLVFVAAQVFAYWENREPLARARIKVLGAGVAISAALAIPTFANNAFGGGDFPMQLGLLSVPIFYTSVTYAILQHDLFDIDRVVRLGFGYAVLSFILVSAYAAVLILPARLGPTFAESQAVLQIVFILVLALTLDPLRRAVQRLIDRAFYRTRLDYRDTISELSEAMTTLLDPREVVDRATRVLAESMHLESTSLCVFDEGANQYRLYSRRGTGSVELRPPVDALAPLTAAVGVAPAEFNPARVAAVIDDAIARTSAVAFLDAERTALLLPLLVRRHPIGFFALGPKRSGQAFDADDVALLRTLAHQVAIALQNARSYQELADLTATLDEKVRRRTDELHVSNQSLRTAYDELKRAQAQLVQSEKMASLGLLVAGVAHEINNPVSFIVANLQPLRRRIDALRAMAAARGDAELSGAVERVHEVLDIVGRGAERTASIVQDLRTFSRPGESHTQMVDLHGCLDVTLRLLRPHWADRITVHRDYGELPNAEIVPGEINQVFMNVLANACDAISGPGNIWIRTGCAEGTVTVSVRDDGAGIDPADADRIFDPFFTTKAFGKGTGLGLAISHGIVTRYGGTIEVKSAPTAGTTFTISLPVSNPG